MPDRYYAQKWGTEVENSLSKSYEMPKTSKSTREKRTRSYCWTIHNFTASIVIRLRHVVESSNGRVRYLLFGRERGAETGRRHLQGYVLFKNPQGMRAAKRVIGVPQAHFEICRGSPQSNILYCRKDGDWESYGDEPKQGARSDLETIQAEIESGASDLEVAKRHFGQWCYHRRSFAEYREMLSRTGAIRKDLRVYLLLGRTGVGKTRFVFNRDPALWPNPDVELKWFDGYCGQSTALIDDYRGGAPLEWLLRVLDIYPVKVPVKGGFVEWRPSEIWLTSNDDMDLWYPDKDISPLVRRVTRVIDLRQLVNTEWEDVKKHITESINSE